MDKEYLHGLQAKSLKGTTFKAKNMEEAGYYTLTVHISKDSGDTAEEKAQAPWQLKTARERKEFGKMIRKFEYIFAFAFLLIISIGT